VKLVIQVALGVLLAVGVLALVIESPRWVHQWSAKRYVTRTCGWATSQKASKYPDMYQDCSYVATICGSREWTNKARDACYKVEYDRKAKEDLERLQRELDKSVEDFAQSLCDLRHLSASDCAQLMRTAKSH
jgi:predicted phosphohydrolase